MLIENEKKGLRKSPELSRKTKEIINLNFIDLKPIYKRAREIVDSKYFKIQKLKKFYKNNENSKICNSKSQMVRNKKENNQIFESQNENKQFNQNNSEKWVKEQNQWNENKNSNIMAKRVENDFIEKELIKNLYQPNITRNSKISDNTQERQHSSDNGTTNLKKTISHHISSISPIKNVLLIKNKF